MKLFAVVLTALLFFCGCGFKEREATIKQKEMANEQKEQQLLLWEQRLTLKEKELEQNQHLLDSTKKEIDSAIIYNPDLVGKWHVKMRCTETNCDGSAIGDIKTEQWLVDYENNNIEVKVFIGDQLNRIYNGAYKQGILSLHDKQLTSDTKITVTLNFVKDKKLEGTREIIKENCKIVYSVVAERL